MIPVYVQLRIGSRIFSHNRSWGFATTLRFSLRQSSAAAHAGKRFVLRIFRWKSIWEKIGSGKKGEAFLFRYFGVLVGAMCFAKLFDRRFIGGMREVFVLHPRLLREWKPSENKKNSCRLKRRIWGRSKLRMVQVSDVGIFIGRYPHKIITWFLQRYRSVLFLESDFVRGFGPVDPERVLLGDVTRDVG